MREIFFEEKLGETRRNSEGGASRTGRDGFLGEKLGGTLRHSERLGVRVVIEVWRLEKRGWYIFFGGLIY